jgi:hypothetical protein
MRVIFIALLSRSLRRRRRSCPYAHFHSGDGGGAPRDALEGGAADHRQWTVLSFDGTEAQRHPQAD